MVRANDKQLQQQQQQRNGTGRPVHVKSTFSTKLSTSKMAPDENSLPKKKINSFQFEPIKFFKIWTVGLATAVV